MLTSAIDYIPESLISREARLRYSRVLVKDFRVGTAPSAGFLVAPMDTEIQLPIDPVIPNAETKGLNQLGELPNTSSVNPITAIASPMKKEIHSYLSL
jgi:hypothetical protein